MYFILIIIQEATIDKLYEIPGINNYKINKKGDVFSTLTNKFITKLNTGRGYIHYILFENNKRKAYFRHYLLALAFIKNDNANKNEIDHINGIPGDDRLCNLRWVTHKENVNNYHSSKIKKLIREPVVLKELKTGAIIKFDSHIECSKYLKVHRYEVLRRLNMRFGYIFKDMTQIKYLKDNREFPVYGNITLAREEFSNISKIKLYNHYTKEIKLMESMSAASNFLKISISTLSTKLRHCGNKVFSSGWEAKLITDNTPWSNLTKSEYISLSKGGKISAKPIVITNVLTGERHITNTSREACSLIGGTPTKIWYRLKVNKNKPCPDGYIYTYLDQQQAKSNDLSLTQMKFLEYNEFPCNSYKKYESTTRTYRI